MAAGDEIIPLTPQEVLDRHDRYLQDMERSLSKVYPIRCNHIECIAKAVDKLVDDLVSKDKR